MLGNQLQHTVGETMTPRKPTYVVFGDVDQQFAFEEHLEGKALILQLVDQLEAPRMVIATAWRRRTSRADGVKPV